MYKIYDKIKLYHESHEKLSARGQTLAVVKIQRSIFKGDPLSPLLFVMAMIPPNYIL